MRIPGHVPEVGLDPAADPIPAGENVHAAEAWSFRCSCGVRGVITNRSAAQQDMTAHMQDRAAAIGLA